MLGVIAIKAAGKTMDEYVEDMRQRQQTDTRIKEITDSLGRLQ
jgi:hypothetical protein